MFKWVLALAALFWLPGAACAAQKAAVFPFEIDFQPSEEDFSIGEQKASPRKRPGSRWCIAEFQKLLTADGRYEAVDLSGLSCRNSRPRSRSTNATNATSTSPRRPGRRSR